MHCCKYLTQPVVNTGHLYLSVSPSLSLSVQHLVPWMRSEKFHERLRAVDISLYLLKAAVDHPEFCVSDP